MSNLIKRIEHLEVLRARLTPIEPVPFDQPKDVLAVLAEQVNAARADLGVHPAEKARTLGALSAVALKAMEVRDLAARLAAVERVLKLRKAEEKQSSKER
jgi:hypothetical protein